MRIGIDCRLWNETGIGRYTRNLIWELQDLDRKNEYVLFTLSKNFDQFKIYNSKFKIVKADVKWHTLDEQIRLPGILKKENLDLVHFLYFSVPIFYNRPFVVTIHDLIVDHFSTGYASALPQFVYGLKLLAYKFVLKQAAKKAKKIIAVSNATKNEVMDHLKIDGGKILVTYEGVESTMLNSRPEIKKTNIKGKYFLYVGNAYPHKNLDRLLEAFKILNSDVSMVFIGKEDFFYRRLRRKVEELNLSEKTIFENNIKDEKLLSLYNNALALVMPSLMEGFGLPALEAMGNNCLVLASDIPSLQEICGDAAIYFDPHDVNDMMRKLKEVYRSSTYYYSDKKKKGLKRAENFSWKKTAEETLKIYESSVSV